MEKTSNDNWTKAECTKIIEKNKNKTAYFNYELTIYDMYDMLRNRMHFGEPETKVIIASLIKAGAKFK